MGTDSSSVPLRVPKRGEIDSRYIMMEYNMILYIATLLYNAHLGHITDFKAEHDTGLYGACYENFEKTDLGISIRRSGMCLI